VNSFLLLHQRAKRHENQSKIDLLFYYLKALWWGEMAPLLKKSPDLGNSSPTPRALIYNRASYRPP
jgi:hypothetical protein